MAAARRGLIVLGALVAGCGGEESRAPADPGARVYAEQGCSSCHVLGGTGGTVGPSLDRAGLSPREVERWVREGGTNMPAFADRLTPAQISALGRYVARAARG